MHDKATKMKPINQPFYRPTEFPTNEPTDEHEGAF